MEKQMNPQEIIDNYIKEFNDLLCDLILDLQSKQFDVGQGEVSNLCSRFSKELWYLWARNYYKDEVFRFALMHPEEARDENAIRRFLDITYLEDILWSDVPDAPDYTEDYIQYKEEMEKKHDELDHMSGPCKYCGVTETDRDIHVQPINKKRINRYRSKVRRPKDIKSMTDFYDYIKDDNDDDDLEDFDF